MSACIAIRVDAQRSVTPTFVVDDGGQCHRLQLDYAVRPLDMLVSASVFSKEIARCRSDFYFGPFSALRALVKALEPLRVSQAWYPKLGIPLRGNVSSACFEVLKTLLSEIACCGAVAHFHT